MDYGVLQGAAGVIRGSAVEEFLAKGFESVRTGGNPDIKTFAWLPVERMFDNTIT